MKKPYFKLSDFKDDINCFVGSFTWNQHKDLISENTDFPVLIFHPHIYMKIALLSEEVTA